MFNAVLSRYRYVLQHSTEQHSYSEQCGGMNALKAEMERKRKATEELMKASSLQGEQPCSVANNKHIRFLSQRDVLRSQEMHHVREQRLLDERRGANSIESSLVDSSSSGGGAGSTCSSAYAAAADARDSQHHDDKKIIESSSARLAEDLQADADRVEAARKYESLRKLSADRIKQMLRSLGQPVTFFGETANERILRLQELQERIERLANETDDFKLDTKSGHNIRNVFIHGNGARARAAADDEDDDVDDSGNKGGKAFDPNAPEPIFHNAANMTDEMKVSKYFKRLLNWWDYDLSQRGSEGRLTAKGRLDNKTFRQCKDYMKPLFKLCLKQQVHPDILERLLEIVKCCETGDFRTANDAYIRVAIGNSAWPIGLTMVGIHERSSREKISSSNVAHAMNNELQRKYLTSVKRLVTFAQTKREDVAPSMKVL